MKNNNHIAISKPILKHILGLIFFWMFYIKVDLSLGFKRKKKKKTFQI